MDKKWLAQETESYDSLHEMEMSRGYICAVGRSRVGNLRGVTEGQVVSDGEHTNLSDLQFPQGKWD